jgi:putative FmdB family regulatory protein
VPIYEYKCNQCGTVIEIIRPMSEAGLPPTDGCTECKAAADQLERVYSVASGHMKHSPEEMQQILRKRSNDWNRKNVIPNQVEIERKVLGPEWDGHL